MGTKVTSKFDIFNDVKNPVEFLTNQINLDIDAVELVKESNEDFR